MKSVCIVIASRANYGRSKTLIKALSKNEKIKLTIVVGGSLITDKFFKEEENSYCETSFVHYDFLLQSQTHQAQAIGTGVAIIELSTYFKHMKPDYVVTIADRYETMATAIAASYQNINLIHLQGGDISGNIDDKVRHAITRLSDIHFPASEESKNNLIRMGEDPERIYMLGCPSMDHVKSIKNDADAMGNLLVKNRLIKDLEKKKYVLIVMHGVTVNNERNIGILDTLLEIVNKYNDIKFVIIEPNVDAGSTSMSNRLDKIHEARNSNVQILESLDPISFTTLIVHAKLCIGNSSSFLREAALSGTHSIILGDRQNGREMGNNCVQLEAPTKVTLEKTIEYLWKQKDPVPDYKFGKGDAGQMISDKIAELPKLLTGKRDLWVI